MFNESAMTLMPPGECFLEELTRSEREVLALVASGLGNKQIAARRGVTEQTVKNQISIVISKLQAQNRTHAVMVALSRGWLQNPLAEHLAQPGAVSMI